MGGQTHVIYICGRLTVFRHRDRTVPETEVIDSVRALSHSEEGLAVSSLYAHHKDIFTVPLDGSGIECRMDAEALHKIWIGLLIEIVTPEKRRMLRCQHGAQISFIYTVAFYRCVLSGNEGFMVCLQPLKSLLKCHKIWFWL